MRSRGTRGVDYKLYTVSFSPILDSVGRRKALMRTLAATLGVDMFDGAQLITPHALPAVSLNLKAQIPRNAQQYNIDIMFHRDLHQEEPLMIQVFNIVLKNCISMLGLTRVRQNYFDHTAPNPVRQWNLDVWPGFITSMREMESELMMNVDITYRVCRVDSVLDMLAEHGRSNPNPEVFRRTAEQELVGTIVMTRYNRMTFRVDGIEWERRPTETFPLTRGGVTPSLCSAQTRLKGIQ
jgi:aubergine-like protein